MSDIKNTNLIPPSAQACINKLNPFGKFCVTIGMIPSSYKASLTYEEQLLWFCNYLEETVIPAVNNNGEAVAELQGLYEQLRNYVNDYFTNLDVQKEINNKLDEMAQSGELTNLIAKYVNPFILEQNKTIAQNKQDTDALINQQNTIIQGLASGNPIPVSSINEMKDTSKIYLLTSTGYWYFYNGSEWTQGGVYQTSESSDAVSDLQSYFEKTINLFEYKKAKDGYYISLDDGQEVAHATFVSSDFIEITPGLPYTLLAPNHIAWYTSDKTFISATNTAPATAPANAKFARFDLNKDVVTALGLTIDTIMFVQGDNVPLSYIPPINPSYQILEEKINGGFEKTNNLFNFKAIKDGYYIGLGDGQEVAHATFVSSDFIEITPGLPYTLSAPNHIAWYTSDKTFISATNTAPATAPANAKFVRFDLNKDVVTALGLTIDTIMFVQGDNVPNYFIPYLTPVNKIPKDKIDGLNDYINDWKDKNILLYGDSITALSNPDSPIGSWGGILKNYLKLSNAYARGVGGQKFVWNDEKFQVNSNGEYVNRGTASDNCLGCFCSFQRIDLMIPENIRNSIDLIFIMGGTNDLYQDSEIGNTNYNSSQNSDTQWLNNATFREFNGDYDITTFKGGLASTIMKMQAICPNAIIVIGSLLSGSGTSGQNQTNYYINNLGLKAEDYAKATKEVAEEFSIPYIDVFGTTGINQLNRKNYISDNIHPNFNGQKMLSRSIISGLKNILPL